MKHINTVFKPLLLPVLLALLAAPVLAQEDVDRRVEADSDGLVVVKNVAGSVVVTTWDRDEVEVTGTLGRGAERLDVIEKSGRTFIKVVLPDGRKRNIRGSDLEIRVPAGSSLEVETVSAEIEVSGVRGAVDLQSVSGEIDIEATVPEAELETVSGDIDARVETDDLSVKTVSGKVFVEGAGGEIVIGTVSGAVEIDGTLVDELGVNSVSGDITFSGGLSGEADIHIESHSGEVGLVLGGDIDAEFEVSTFSGDIESDFGGRAHRTSRYTPGKELEFTVGDGSAKVEIETFSGDVTILDK